MSRQARPRSTTAAKCRACADVCPERAITFPLLPKKQAQAAPLPVDDEIPEGDRPCP